MAKKAAIFLFIMSLTVTLTGCWNNRDLTEIAISTAFGIDITEDGKTMVSVQIVKPSAAKPSGKEGGGDKKGFVVVSNTADTVFGALREMLSKVDNKIFYSTSQVIVIGEDAAKSGIKDFMDFVLRDHETQYKSLVVIAKGTTAKEILEQEYDLSKVPGAYVRDTLKNADARGFTKKMMLIEIARELVTEGRELSIGTIEKKEKTTVTDGMAVFSGEKMVGWMDEFETRGYMFIAGKIKSTVLEVDNPQKPDKQIAVEVLKSDVKKEFKWGDNGIPAFNLKIEVKGNIGEQYGDNTFRENELINDITKICNEKIKKEAFQAIRKCQKEYKSDIFGFGMSVFDKNPKYWKSVKDIWNIEIFPNTEVNIEVDTKLLRSGLLDKAIEVK